MRGGWENVIISCNFYGHHGKDSLIKLKHKDFSERVTGNVYCVHVAGKYFNQYRDVILLNWKMWCVCVCVSVLVLSFFSIIWHSFVMMWICLAMPGGSALSKCFVTGDTPIACLYHKIFTLNTDL